MKTFAFPGTFAFRRMPFHNRANKSSGTSRRHLCAKTLKDGKYNRNKYKNQKNNITEKKNF